jgi:hypothetical protein
MATVSITKIQLRRGLASDLPGQPTSLSPLAFPEGLDEGELGYTTDTGRLFVGIGSGATGPTGTVPLTGMPNFQRFGFPYQNIEVLTENSPLQFILGEAFADNQLGFIQTVPLIPSSTFQTLQVANYGVMTDFKLDLATGVGSTSAIISYFIFDSTMNPIRQGRLSVLWNTSMATVPLCTDEAQVAIGNVNAIQWQALQKGSLGNNHIVLQYINNTGDSPLMFLRVDRPNPQYIGDNGPVGPSGVYQMGGGGVLPLSYILSGKPKASAFFNSVIAVPLTIPANFAGTVVYASTRPTANAIFTVVQITGGVNTTVGTITLTPASSPVLSSQAAISLAPGDVLQLHAPSVSDATLSDVGITIYTTT